MMLGIMIPAVLKAGLLQRPHLRILLGFALFAPATLLTPGPKPDMGHPKAVS